MNKYILEELCKTDNTRQIAEKLNVSQTKVNNWLRKFELVTPRSKGLEFRKAKAKYTCINCGTEKYITSHSIGKYCNSRCKADYLQRIYIEKWKQGLETGCTLQSEVSNYVRNYLLSKYKCSCIKCGWNERHPVDGKPLVQINHIDGNSSNCVEENLEVICPSCHSMTSNFGARNKVSARPKRYLREKVLNKEIK